MPRPNSPNILFIMDDQQRHNYLGAASADFLRTPHLDRLAGRSPETPRTESIYPIRSCSRLRPSGVDPQQGVAQGTVVGLSTGGPEQGRHSAQVILK